MTLQPQNDKNEVFQWSDPCYYWEMKWYWALLLLILAWVTACGPSGLDEKGLPYPSAALAAKAGVSVDEMGEGYWVYSRKCMECHGVKLPTGDLEGQWHPVVVGMAGNAGLSISEETAIVNYVRAATQL